MSPNTYVLYSDAPEVSDSLSTLIDAEEGCRVVAKIDSQDVLADMVEKHRPTFLVVDLGHTPHETAQKN